MSTLRLLNLFPAQLSVHFGMIELALLDGPANITNVSKSVHMAGALTVLSNRPRFRLLWFPRWGPSRRYARKESFEKPEHVCSISRLSFLSQPLLINSQCIISLVIAWVLWTHASLAFSDDVAKACRCYPVYTGQILDRSEQLSIAEGDYLSRADFADMNDLLKLSDVRGIEVDAR